MATANKPTGLHILLVFAFMAMIITLVAAFLEYRKASDMEVKLTGEKTEHEKASGDLRVAQADLQTLKEVLGWPNTPEVGKLQSEGDATVVGQCKQLIAKVAPGDSALTVEATLHRLDSDLDAARQENNGLKADKIRLSDQITAMRSEYQKLVDAHDKARTDAEKDRNEAQKSKEDSVKEKEKEIADHQTKIQELQAAVQQQGQEMSKFKEDSKKRVDILEKTNIGLRADKALAEKPTFEVPSATVQWVDTETRSVWINRGEADALRKGTTFSVYKKINNGVARGAQDIKGAIEVTRVVGPHQSEARITKSKIDDPIVIGDPVYTPLWRAGVKEKFAFVGLIDLDNDGVSDRDVLHDLVKAANGEIVDEVDDQGNRHPANGNITVATKFLVIGKIPDYTESRPDEQPGHKKIADLKTRMVNEALENGVRVVSMEDFLNYIGYDPGRRIWRPGVTETWNLRSGAQGTAARPDANGRIESSGSHTSGLFNDTGAKRRESSGVRTPASQ